MVYKIAAVDPAAICEETDFLLVRPYLGQSNGTFIVNIPPRWLKAIHARADLDDVNWRWGPAKKVLLEYFAGLHRQGAFFSAPHDGSNYTGWEALLETCPVRDEFHVVVGRRGGGRFSTFDDLDPQALEAPSTVKPVGNRFEEQELVRLMSPFLRKSGRVALVDRHNSLEDPYFGIFLRGILNDVVGHSCHEIIIYARHKPDKLPYLKDSGMLKEKLVAVVGKLPLPTCGIRYLSCDEFSKSNKSDLHARRVVTNNCLLMLQDSIAGKTRSQSLTRINSSEMLAEEQSYWLDGNHGLDIAVEATIQAQSVAP